MEWDIENIFRASNSNEELFDAFQWALKKEIHDINVYKVLLANPTLTQEELKMYSETLAKLYKNSSYDIYLWTGQILEITAHKGGCVDEVINYYIKAWKSNKENEKPLLNLLKMYDHELHLPHNNLILNIVEEGLSRIKKKSPVYYALSELFNKKGNIELKRKYMSLAEKEALKGC